MSNRHQHTTDGPNAPARQGPSEAQRAASHAFAARFEQLREESDELLRLQRAAERMFAARPAAEFDGFSRVLDALLPRDADGQRRVARAVEVDANLLQRLRSSALDPLDAPPAPVAALSRAIRLDFPTFWALAQRDHERLAAHGMRATARAGGARPDATMAAFRDAWERDERDDPAHG